MNEGASGGRSPYDHGALWRSFPELSLHDPQPTKDNGFAVDFHEHLVQEPLPI
jgi:hypothetical protein